MTTRLWTAGILSLAAFTCGAGSLHGVGTPGYAHGVGLIRVPKSEEYPAGLKLFEPTNAYATQSSDPARVWLLVTDRDASTVKWRKAADRSEVLRAWCKAEAASFVLFELDREGVPEQVFECGGSGALGAEMISTINDLTSVAATFEVFDGKRIRGRILSGEGWCGEATYCTKSRDFRVDVEVKP